MIALHFSGLRLRLRPRFWNRFVPVAVSLFGAFVVSVSFSADRQVTWEQPIVGTFTFDVAMGDIDGDMDLDAILVDDLKPSVILLNDGNGNFSVSPTATVLPGALSVALGDLDGINGLDVFLAIHLGPNVVWLNDGNGNFTDSGQVLGPNTSKGNMVLVDIDGDMDLDAVVPTNTTTDANQLWINDGSGTFTLSPQVLGTKFSTDCAVLDVDNDLDLDIAFANNGFNEIYLNDGSGNFSLSPTSLGGITTTISLAFADLDGDLDPDCYMANGSISGQDDEVWLNDGNGTFTDSGQVLTSPFSTAVVLEDIDGDLDVDAIVGTNETQDNVIFLNNGGGVFSLAPATFGIGYVAGIATGDIDGDTDLDFFFSVTGGPSEVWKGVPGGLMDTGQRIGGTQASRCAIGDLDGDMDVDIVIANVGGIATILLNDCGAGQFTFSPQVLVNGFGNNSSDVEIGDLDGDMDLDIFFANSPKSGSADEANRVWFNDGSGNFTVGPQLLGSENTGVCLLVDVDGDTDLDVLVGNAPFGGIGGQNHLYTNNGSGSFTITDALGLENTRALAAGLLNNDAHLDVVVGNLSNTANTVWFGDGAGNFTDSLQLLGSNSTYDVQIFDADGDTDLDLFFSNISGTNRLFTNNGSGVFTDSGQSLGGFRTRKAEIFDCDGDTDLDIWMTNGFTGDAPNRIYLNNGAGVFTDTFVNFGNSGGFDSCAFDFNGDGDIDIFEVNGDGDLRLWADDDSAAIIAYANSFGLTGADANPFADPDCDLIDNSNEYGFNLNPAVNGIMYVEDLATATAGLPKVQLDLFNAPNNLFKAEVVRRIAPEGLFYKFETSPDGILWTEVTDPPATTPINAEFERATYTVMRPVDGTYLARFRAIFSP